MFKNIIGWFKTNIMGAAPATASVDAVNAPPVKEPEASVNTPPALPKPKKARRPAITQAHTDVKSSKAPKTAKPRRTKTSNTP